MIKKIIGVVRRKAEQIFTAMITPTEENEDKNYDYSIMPINEDNNNDSNEVNIFPLETVSIL